MRVADRDVLDMLEKYLGPDFDPDQVELPTETCGFCDRTAATGDDGRCRWCRHYTAEIARVVSA